MNKRIWISNYCGHFSIPVFLVPLNGQLWRHQVIYILSVRIFTFSAIWSVKKPYNLAAVSLSSQDRGRSVVIRGNIKEFYRKSGTCIYFFIYLFILFSELRSQQNSQSLFRDELFYLILRWWSLDLLTSTVVSCGCFLRKSSLILWL